MFLIALALGAFLAFNMGVSGFAVSFAPSYGSNILTKKKAVFLYTICVILGAVLIGPRVVTTLLNKISSFQFLPISGAIIIFASALTILLSHVLGVPQSSSFVTVASFVGASIYYHEVNWQVVGKILVFAMLFSLISFLLTIVIKKKIYPPHQGNIKFYENFFIHRGKFRKFIILQNLYAGFGIGTNNVANVVAPLLIITGIGAKLGLLFLAPFFGLGALLSGRKVIDSLSKEIIPIGEFSASLVSFVTATLVIIASLLGLPTPYVQFITFSLLAISSVKDGFKPTARKEVVRKVISVWILVPIFSTLLSYLLHLALL